MRTRVSVKPEMLRWACRRAGVNVDALAKRQTLRKLPEWLSENEQPTFRQLEDFAKATHAPFGYFFLAEPPEEPVPIPDFRTIGSKRAARPSANMLDTIYACQQRQDWYRQYALLTGEEPREFVGSATVKEDVIRAARQIRAALHLGFQTTSTARNADELFRLLLDRTDELGVIVMVSGIVGVNTHRALDPEEFRGFALSDGLAPLVFVNGADTNSGRLFTLIHELAHIWLGESGVSDVDTASASHATTERWCNAVAAEVLTPLDELRKTMQPHAELWSETKRLAAAFRVSTLVILRRMHDAGRLSREQFSNAYGEEAARLSALMHKRKEEGKSGGNFYATARYRLSKRFASAVIASTWEGRSTFTEAFRLLGCRNVQTLENLGEHLGMTGSLRGGPV